MWCGFTQAERRGPTDPFADPIVGVFFSGGVGNLFLLDWVEVPGRLDYAELLRRGAIPAAVAGGWYCPVRWDRWAVLQNDIAFLAAPVPIVLYRRAMDPPGR